MHGVLRIIIQNPGQVCHCNRHLIARGEVGLISVQPSGKTVSSQAHFLKYSAESVSFLFITQSTVFYPVFSYAIRYRIMCYYKEHQLIVHVNC
jgi:hypothetical protein